MSGLVSDPYLLYTFDQLAGARAISGHAAGRRSGMTGLDKTPMPSTDLMNRPSLEPTMPAPALNGFQRDAAAHIEAVRQTIAAMVESSGTQILKSRDAEKAFGVDANLSWQLFKLLSYGDLLGLAKYIPAAVSMKRVFSACRKRRVAEALITAAEGAFDQFEAFVALHAEDRAAFESMVSSMSQGEEAVQTDIQHRKALFRSHTHFWGIEVGTMYLLSVIGPSRDNPEVCDNVYVSNQLDFRRLRPNADTHVMGTHIQKKEEHIPERDPVDAQAMQMLGIPVLPQFSTNALPLMRTQTDEWGRTRTRLIGESVGLTSSVDFAFGEVMHGITDAFSEQPFQVATRSVISRPTRRMIMDVMVDRRVFRNITPVVQMYGHASIAVSPEDHEKPEWAIPCRERVQHLQPTDDARLAEVPRRRELLSYIFDRQGWSLDHFDIYRLHVEYPILDTALVMLLTRPGSK